MPKKAEDEHERTWRAEKRTRHKAIQQVSTNHKFCHLETKRKGSIAVDVSKNVVQLSINKETKKQEENPTHSPFPIPVLRSGKSTMDTSTFFLDPNFVR